MQNELNQEQIDAMVRAARSGGADAGKAKEPKVEPWDVRRAGQIRRGNPAFFQISGRSEESGPGNAGEEKDVINRKNVIGGEVLGAVRRSHDVENQPRKSSEPRRNQNHIAPDQSRDDEKQKGSPDK